MPSLTTPSLPTKQTAVVGNAHGMPRLNRDAAVPLLGPNVALVKTAAVAMNPVDGKMLAFSPVPGAVLGYDFSGTIVALGDDTPTHLRVGDRVAGTVNGMNPNLPDVGAFSEYLAAQADMILKIPDDMAFQDAASIGLGLFTAGLGLFRELKIPGEIDPFDPNPNGKEWVLVAGGSTATGTRAIQLLKL